MTTHSVDDARGAVVTGHLRYILGISLAGSIVAMIAVAIFA